jgi:hypothetical protein
MVDRSAPAPRILLANEPRLYRDVLAAALAQLRPQSRVLTADAPELDAAVAHHRPDFVVCSGLTEAVRSQALAWAVLYPAGSRHADIGLAGARLTLHEVEFTGLLMLHDCAATLAQMREKAVPGMSQRKLAHP